MSDYDNFGDYLRFKREALRFSRSEIADRTHVPVKVIRQLEDNKFDELPEWMYMKTHLVTIATDLGLDQEELINEFQYHAKKHDYKLEEKSKPREIDFDENETSNKKAYVFIAFFILAIGVLAALSVMRTAATKETTTLIEQFSNETQIDNPAAQNDKTHIKFIATGGQTIHFTIGNGNEQNIYLSKDETQVWEISEPMVLRVDDDNLCQIWENGELLSIEKKNFGPNTFTFPSE